MDYIGRYVKEFESGNSGCLTLGSCGNDWGLSCGSYQLTLRWGNCINFLKQYFPEIAVDLYFNNLEDIKTSDYPGRKYCSCPDDVKNIWLLCYESVGADDFFKYEHQYIMDQYYEPLMRNICNIFNPNDHSRAIQECLWSWSVHKGVYYVSKELKKLNISQDMCVSDLLNKIYDLRYNTDKFARFSKSNHSERHKLLNISEMDPFSYFGSSPSSRSVPFTFRISCEVLNIYREPNLCSHIAGQISDKLKYTIVDTKDNWGKLKSGIGWIPLNYIVKCKKI